MQVADHMLFATAGLNETEPCCRLSMTVASSSKVSPLIEESDFQISSEFCSPELCLTCPSNVLIRVLFPAPLGPINPIRSPRRTVVEKLSNSFFFPNVRPSLFASITRRPDFDASISVRSAVCSRSRRAARSRRSCSRARTRPSFLVRRALIPCRIPPPLWPTFVKRGELVGFAINSWSCSK